MKINQRYSGKPQSGDTLVKDINENSKKLRRSDTSFVMFRGSAAIIEVHYYPFNTNQHLKTKKPGST